MSSRVIEIFTRLSRTYDVAQ